MSFKGTTSGLCLQSSQGRAWGQSDSIDASPMASSTCESQGKVKCGRSCPKVIINNICREERTHNDLRAHQDATLSGAAIPSVHPWTWTWEAVIGYWSQHLLSSCCVLDMAHGDTCFVFVFSCHLLYSLMKRGTELLGHLFKT